MWHDVAPQNVKVELIRGAYQAEARGDVTTMGEWVVALETAATVTRL